MNARRHRHALDTAERLLSHYGDRKATHAALRLVTSDVLGYRARWNRGYQLAAESVLARLVAAGVTPATVLARVIAFYLVTERRPFRMQREEDAALGRWIAHTVPYRRKRGPTEKLPSVNCVREIGEITREALGVFAVGLLRKAAADAVERSALVRECLDFDTSADAAP